MTPSRHNRTALLLGVALVGVVLLAAFFLSRAGSTAPPQQGTVPPTALDGASVDSAEATAVATRFAPQYLRYLRGRLEPRELTGITPGYRRALTENRPRVSPASRERPLRLAGTPTVTRQASNRILVSFPVTTGETSFVVPLAVERTDGRWTVVSSGDAD